MTFNKWIDTFIAEKGLNLDAGIEVEGPSGRNYMRLEIVVNAIKQANDNEQRGIKNTLVKIDFANGDPMHFFRHLAGAIAC